MPDIKIKLPRDLSKVNVNDFGEFIWWCNHYGINMERMLSIIEKVGNSTIEIRKHLNR